MKNFIIDKLEPINMNIICISKADILNRKGNKGDLIITTDTKEEFIWLDGVWEKVGDCDLDKSEYQDEIITVKCPNCGAPLDLDNVRADGTCRCDYCRSFVKVKGEIYGKQRQMVY